MDHDKHEAPWVPEGDAKTLGITHGSTEAGALATFPFSGSTLPETKVDLTTKEAASIPEAPGVG